MDRETRLLFDKLFAMLDDIGNDVSVLKDRSDSQKEALDGEKGLIQTVARHTQQLDVGNASERTNAAAAIICTLVAVASLIMTIIVSMGT